MKKLLITSTILTLLATPALALDFGNGIALNNTITAEYSVETDVFTTTYEPQLQYSLGNGVVAYAETLIDLQDIDFVGLDIGLEYTPAKFDKLTVTTEVQFDADLGYSDVVVKAELTF
jgi:opacity protein-like surface antigen